MTETAIKSRETKATYGFLYVSLGPESYIWIIIINFPASNLTMDILNSLSWFRGPHAAFCFHRFAAVPFLTFVSFCKTRFSSALFPNQHADLL